MRKSTKDKLIGPSFHDDHDVFGPAGFTKGSDEGWVGHGCFKLGIDGFFTDRGMHLFFCMSVHTNT